MGYVVFILLVYSVACGVYSAVIAQGKGRSRYGWFFGGLFFGIIGLVAAGLIVDRWTEEENHAREIKEKLQWLQASEAGKPKKF